MQGLPLRLGAGDSLKAGRRAVMGWHADGSQGLRGVSSQIWEARGGF